MGKLVVLKFGDGSFDVGFAVTLQIGASSELPNVEIVGRLPAAPQLLVYYQHWQSSYQSLGSAFRLSADQVQVTNVSITGDCQANAQILSGHFNSWLQSDGFRALREKWLECLNTVDEIRVILQTENSQILRLPWHTWDLLSRYNLAEIAIASPNYERSEKLRQINQKVKILAVVGDSRGIDTQADQEILQQHLPNTDITFLVEPGRQQLNDYLWESHWDILFFAGHSVTDLNESGRIYLNQTDSLSMTELRYALAASVANGLYLAIFNSCDGFGLARELSCLQIPEIIFMRERVPDAIASKFLQYFLNEFAKGTAFYLAVRRARERLQGLEDKFPCATWLPMIFQNNPIQEPLTWHQLQLPVNTITAPKPRSHLKKFKPELQKNNFQLHRRRALINSVVMTLLVLSLRFLGLFENIELKTFDQMLWLRSLIIREQPDPRIVLVTVNDADLAQQRQKGESLKGTSISDKSLRILLEKLQQYQPSVIGLDVYRDFKSEDSQLTTRLQQTQNLIAICKGSDTSINSKGIAPPPEIERQHTSSRLGFSDFVRDQDGIIRRHLLFMNQDAQSLCAADFSLSLQLAFEYFKFKGVNEVDITLDKKLKIGKAIFNPLTSHSNGYQRIDANGGQILLNWRATDKIAQLVSLTEVLTGQVNPNAFKDKIVLLGVVAKGDLQDYLPTPYGENLDTQKPGVIIHAHMLSQILSHVLDNRSLLQTWKLEAEVIWILSWSIVGAILALRLRKQRIPLLITIITTTGILYILCFGLMILSYWVPFFPSALALIGTSVMFVVSNERAYVKD
jgi:CHASE2 domain-containing sensor protein